MKGKSRKEKTEENFSTKLFSFYAQIKLMG